MNALKQMVREYVTAKHLPDTEAHFVEQNALVRCMAYTIGLQYGTAEYRNACHAIKRLLDSADSVASATLDLM
jgi:hypothetical protein